MSRQHPRKVVRDAIRDRLKETGDVDGFRTIAGDDVYSSRIAPVNDEDYPAILIYSRDEKDYSEPEDGSLVWRGAVLHVVIECLIRAGENVDDKLDAFALQVEDALDGWRIPSMESAELRLSETDIDVVTENVRRPIGAIGLTYKVTYRAARLPEPDEPAPVDSWPPEPPFSAPFRPDDVFARRFGPEPAHIVRDGDIGTIHEDPRS